jgi:molybdate transport system regulatory protein
MQIRAQFRSVAIFFRPAIENLDAAQFLPLMGSWIRPRDWTMIIRGKGISMAYLSIRIDFGPDLRVGPGKIILLEHIGSLGSISAAGRAMDMSYRRAWELIEELNTIFGQPVVVSRSGGKKGGGAALTPLGQSLIARYRDMESAASQAAQPHLDALAGELSALSKPANRS